MKKTCIVVCFLLFSVNLYAENVDLPLDSMTVDYTNKASLQRGMQTYVNNCLACHSLKYQRYDRTATDIGIPLDLLKDNLIFDDQAITGSILSAMPTEDSQKWFGKTPPDLSLETTLRGTDWVYTYLRSFYLDESRPWGVNNLVLKNTSMPNVLGYLQGEQLLNCSIGELTKEATSQSSIINTEHCFQLEEGTGKQTTEAFDRTIYDLVNFISYVAQPHTIQSKSMGMKVLAFLFIFFCSAFALKKEYWRDIR